jgi:hypothetical protein
MQVAVQLLIFSQVARDCVTSAYAARGRIIALDGQLTACSPSSTLP